MAPAFNTAGGYSTFAADKSELTNAQTGYTDPVLGIPLNTSTDFLWAMLVELRIISQVLKIGLNVNEPLLVDSDPTMVPQSTGTPPNFQ